MFFAHYAFLLHFLGFVIPGLLRFNFKLVNIAMHAVVCILLFCDVCNMFIIGWSFNISVIRRLRELQRNRRVSNDSSARCFVLLPLLSRQNFKVTFPFPYSMRVYSSYAVICLIDSSLNLSQHETNRFGNFSAKMFSVWVLICLIWHNGWIKLQARYKAEGWWYATSSETSSKKCNFPAFRSLFDC